MGVCGQSLYGHSSGIDSVTFDASEGLVAAGAASGTIKLWDLEEAKGKFVALCYSKLLFIFSASQPFTEYVILVASMSSCQNSHWSQVELHIREFSPIW